MYADVMTKSMVQAIDETTRRRDKQIAYNLERGIDPQPLRKKIADITAMLQREEADTVELLAQSSGKKSKTGTSGNTSPAGIPRIGAAGAGELESIIVDLNEQMLVAAAELKFELAARLRDELSELKRELRIMKEAGHA
jgi:excinuclease ABC subunit B